MPYLLLIILFTSFCSKKEQTPVEPPKTFNLSVDSITGSSGDEVLEELDTTLIEDNTLNISNEELQNRIDQLIDFDPTKPIDLDSPKRFLQISILFTLAQNSNYATIAKKENVKEDEIIKYMNEQRESFYKKLGITETEYINYSVRRSADIQDFLATNPKFAEVYEVVQTQVSD